MSKMANFPRLHDGAYFAHIQVAFGLTFNEEAGSAKNGCYNEQVDL
jgi:hypothetical protein